MDQKPSEPTEQILNLTLEIILLLTGEDYFLMKKPDGRATNNSLQLEEESWRVLTDVHIPLPQSVMHEPQNKQKILELTKKITELLTGEVPIRCQDATVHFSMEEWEYVEGHKEMYMDFIMENHQTFASLGLPKSSYPPMRIKEEQEQYEENLTNADLYTLTDHIHHNFSPPINEEPGSCDGRNLAETTEQYACPHIKEEPISCNGGTLTNQNLYTPTNTRQDAYTCMKEEPNSCNGRNFKKPKNTPFDQTQQYLPTQIKDGLVLQDGESVPNPNIYTIKDHIQQCSSHVNEEPVLCSEGNLIFNAHYPSTHAKEVANLPETQSRANDNINVQFSCSECKKCFLSMSELVSHQGIHIAEKLFQKGTHVFTTAIVQAPQLPPVKHKLLTCSKCGRTFYTKSSLVGHMKTHWSKVNHLQKETFKCDQCGKCFSSNSLLHMHFRLHFEDRPYACSTCGDRFMRTSDLGRHNKKHK